VKAEEERARTKAEEEQARKKAERERAWAKAEEEERARLAGEVRRPLPPTSRRLARAAPSSAPRFPKSALPGLRVLRVPSAAGPCPKPATAGLDPSRLTQTSAGLPLLYRRVLVPIICRTHFDFENAGREFFLHVEAIFLYVKGNDGGGSPIAVNPSRQIQKNKN
jgi:hypothetical protein